MVPVAIGTDQIGAVTQIPTRRFRDQAPCLLEEGVLAGPKGGLENGAVLRLGRPVMRLGTLLEQ